MVIMVMGLPGSGKSYFASKLAQKIGADYSNSDQIRKDIFSERTYSNSEKAKVYEILFKKMLIAIEQEKDIVLDATFSKNELRDKFLKHCKGNVAVIEIWTDEKNIRERLKIPREQSDADFKIYQLIKSEWEPFEQSHLKLKSTNNNLEVMLEKAINYLKDATGRY